jgi:hypothetical protein
MGWWARDKIAGDLSRGKKKDYLLPQGWGRLMRKHNFYWIFVVQVVDVRSSAA